MSQAQEMDRPPPTGADDGLLAAAHVHDLVGAHALHDVEVALDTAHILGRIERQIVQVEAGAEGLALTGQHDDAAVLVHAHLDEEVVELGHLRVGHGVQIVGIVEGADVDRAALLDLQLLVVVGELGQMVGLLIDTHVKPLSYLVAQVLVFSPKELVLL